MNRSRNRRSQKQRQSDKSTSLKMPSSAGLPAPEAASPTDANPSASANDVVGTKPSVSICTLTRNRQAFLPLLQRCVASQTYPHALMEWVIIDDSDNGEPAFAADPDLDIRVKHIRLPDTLILGNKRNFSHELCENQIIVYMDDDDYYPPQRVSHAVERLLETGHQVAGSTMLPIYFTDTGQAWVAGPYGPNHATANTFAFRRELLKISRYDDTATHAEEKAFLHDYKIPMAQLDPTQTILCISHSQNTFDKRKLIAGGKNPRMNKLRDIPDHFISPEILQSHGVMHAQIRRQEAAKVATAAPPKEIVTLDLGCGNQPRNPFQATRVCGIDLQALSHPEADIRATDLVTNPIPWPDASFDHITAFDFLQHIPRIIYCPERRLPFIELMNEIWRCLKVGGTLLSSTPAYPHPEAFQDPAHVNIITEKTFSQYFSDPYWARAYGFKGFFRVKEQQWEGFQLKTVLEKLPAD